MRSTIYNALISKMTAIWYAEVIDRVPYGAQILDVGIGTGQALLANRDALMSRNIHVTGVDIDRTYVDACLAAVAEAGLSDRIEPRLQSVYDHEGGPYDAIYFSASFMLLPSPVGALEHVIGLLKPRGQLYFTQTFEHDRSPTMERLKPLLRLMTTIDFGQVTYEDEFLETLEQGNVDVVENVVIERRRKRSYKLIVADPREVEREQASEEDADVEEGEGAELEEQERYEESKPLSLTAFDDEPE